MMMEESVVGIDEAGRGAVIGPMIVAGVKIRNHKIDLLSKLGVRDSKKLTPHKREELYPEIIELVEDYCIEEISFHDIDRRNLTELELERIAKIVNRLNPKKVIVDSLGNLKRENLIKILKPGIVLIYEKKADDTYPPCQAASIIAKVTRDERIKRLHRKMGFNFGKGYPNKGTMRFIESYFEKENILPLQTRRRWKGVRKILS